MITRAELDLVRVGVSVRLSEDMFLSRPTVEAWCDHLAESIEVQVRGRLAGEQQPEIMIKHPNTWWEAVKERFFPAWLKRRFPVQYRHHHINGAALYPDFKPALPEQRLVWDIHRAERLNRV